MTWDWPMTIVVIFLERNTRHVPPVLTGSSFLWAARSILIVMDHELERSTYSATVLLVVYMTVDFMLHKRIVYNIDNAVDGYLELKNCWIKLYKNDFCSFIKLRLNHWCHMDYFTDFLTMFLSLGIFNLHCSLCRVRKLLDFIKNILICGSKINRGLTGLEWHEGE